MLDNLVVRVVGATADDPRFVPGGVSLDGYGVLADVFEPDVLEGAGAVAVDALGLVLANDHVAEGGAGLEVEDGVAPV